MTYFESFACQIHSDESPLCDQYEEMQKINEELAALDAEEQVSQLNTTNN